MYNTPPLPCHTCPLLVFKVQAGVEAKEEAYRKKAAADAAVFFLFLSLALCKIGLHRICLRLCACEYVTCMRVGMCVY